MKAGIILLLSSAGLVCSAATLITEGLVRFDEVATLQTFLYALFILGVCLSAGAAPVAFEFCMEQCYPVSEGILGSAVQCSIGSTTGCTITEKAPTRAFS